MIVLQWFKPAAAVGLQWLVPVQAFPAPVQSQDLETVAVIAGPPGQNAGDTMDGDRGDIRIQSGQWLVEDIDGGTFN